MRGLSRQNVEKKIQNEMFIHSKTFKNDGFRPIILGIKKYILGRYTLAKLPTSLFSTKGDAEHICDLDHPYVISGSSLMCPPFGQFWSVGGLK